VNTFPNGVVLAAPTSNAASRMTEAAGHPATTIHYLLEAKMVGNKWVYGRNRNNPLELNGRALGIDEWSMLDTETTAAVLEATPLDSPIVLFGDVNQIESVGPGNTVADMIKFGVKTTKLTAIHRTGIDSPIPGIAQSVLDGKVPEIVADSEARFVSVNRSTQGQASYVARVVKGMINSGVAVGDVMVLSPVHHGPYGEVMLNRELQRLWNPEGLAQLGVTIRSKERDEKQSSIEIVETIHPGDRIVVKKTMKNKRIQNGDQFKVISCGQFGDRKDLVRWIDIEDPISRRVIHLEGRDVSNLRLGYARTLHDAQGRQWKNVVMALMNEHQRMLRRNLVYTGITRAQRHISIVGEPSALEAAVYDQGHRFKRETGLSILLEDIRLRNQMGEPRLQYA
jgi:exodeoxyribonuclease V alpha subunit